MVRRLPSVDRILGHAALVDLAREWGPLTVRDAVRGVQAELRRRATPGDANWVPDWAAAPTGYRAAVADWLARHVGSGYRTVFNLTGTLLHSNLGRSLLAPQLADKVLAAATRPVTLEYDLGAGRRGDREGIVAHRLRLLTGAEHAAVVNNNAAALLIVLNTLALDREVPVSRGELIEIGGSFRLPELMHRAGCRLREVGTTNRTHADDYERAVSDQTAALLKVHPSNYRIEGFVSDVAVAALAAISGRHELPLVVDAGSGVLVDLARFGLPSEPTPRQLLRAGTDLVTFSGDKLLGGVQAGVIVGRKDLVDAVNANPLKRALRLDKLALAALDATLKAWENEAAACQEIPLMRTLALPDAVLAQRAEAVRDALAGYCDGGAAEVAIVSSEAQLGSGAMPGRTVPSRAVTIALDGDAELRECARALRRLTPPVIGRIARGRVWLDMRGAEPLDELTEALRRLA